MKQEKENKIVEYVKRFFYIMGGVAIGMTLATLLSGCAPRVITVPEYHTEYVTRTDTFLRIDSVFNNTKTIIREANDGDSALLAEYGIKLRDNERLLLLLRSELERITSDQQTSHTDTFIKNDSILVPYPVEKKLTRWQQAKLDLGGWMVGVILVSFIFFCIYLARGKAFRGK